MAGASGAAGAAGAGGCTQPADCPGQDDECNTRTCDSGVCGLSFSPMGTVVAAQTAGDCKQNVCDGAGAVVSQNDDADPADDGQACTTDTCDAGSPLHTPVALGTSCGSGLVCDANGNCLGCNTPADCAGQDDECKTKTCTSGVCGVDFTANGTAVTNQTAGDCKQNVCDGNGNVTSVGDDTDPASDNKQCTQDVCVSGFTVHPPEASGAACTEAGGSLCNGAGTCVECLVASDCPGQDEDCKVRSCNNGACGIAFTTAGTLTSSQTAGDCKKNVCDGAGNEVTQADNADPGSDGMQCTDDQCVNGNPFHPASAAGTQCNENGGSVCDGSGTCIGCLVPADCASNQCVANECAPNLLFSEYVEGSSNNKALEIANLGSMDVSLSGCQISIYSNGSASAGTNIALGGTVGASSVFQICHSSASFAGSCEQTSGSLSFNGDDAVALVCNGTVLDVIGQIGVDPGTGWGSAPTATVDQTLRRKCTVTHGDPTGSDVFDPATEWDGFAVDSFGDLGTYVCP